jgi:two-component system sensor histidine kinase QseC
VSATAHTETDLELLRSILTNLVDNAVEYAPRGGAIEIEAGAPNGRFTLRVVNAVEHLEERDLPRLFERFWRKDAARTADGHTGLGLALARTYARALGCELTATFAGPSQLALTLVQIEPKSRNKLTLDTGRCGSRDGG